MILLKELRKEKGLTQLQVANALKISRQVYANYENEINQPDCKMLVILANFFEVSVDFLLGRSDDLGNVTVQSSSPALPQDERELLKLFRVLPPEYKQLALNTLRTWTGSADREEKQKKA
ncbi:MAG: helix-turn-helix transcriptional regulator [Clostridia bacterium]|nr:helix-turn-helix transcriptional regulator [Clostridia bacterium]